MPESVFIRVSNRSGSSNLSKDVFNSARRRWLTVLVTAPLVGADRANPSKSLLSEAIGGIGKDDAGMGVFSGLGADFKVTDLEQAVVAFAVLTCLHGLENAEI